MKKKLNNKYIKKLKKENPTNKNNKFKFQN